MTAAIDTSALDVLLQELSADLTPEVLALLDNEQLRRATIEYLNDICSIDTGEYLSSVPPTPASGDFTQEERTLVQDIAELEAQQRSIETQLKNLIVHSQQSIVETKTELSHAEAMFETQFNSTFKSIWHTFNEDDLEDVKDQEDQDLQELEADLDPLDDKDATFHSVVSNVKKLIDKDDDTNKNLSLVLENMDQIINILELPSLTGACIKAGYYSEALEISSYTRRLAIRFPTSDLIREVEIGIKAEMSHMLSGLIRLLRTNLKQSSIIKILSYLRRIPPFSQAFDADTQLKRIMLHARYQFIKSEFESLTPLKESELHEKYLKRSVEVIREHGFGSIMTFKNVFPEIDESELGDVDIIVEEGSMDGQESNDMKDVPVESEPHDGDGEGEKDENDEQDGNGNDESYKKEEKEDADLTELTTEPTVRAPSNLLLFEFVTRIIQELIHPLQSSLPQIKENSTRDGLYLQLTYCSQSLGRIDANFSDQMGALLLNARSKEGGALIDPAAWAHAVEKQQHLAQSLLS